MLIANNSAYNNSGKRWKQTEKSKNLVGFSVEWRSLPRKEVLRSSSERPLEYASKNEKLKRKLLNKKKENHR